MYPQYNGLVVISYHVLVACSHFIVSSRDIDGQKYSGSVSECISAQELCRIGFCKVTKPGGGAPCSLDSSQVHIRLQGKFHWIFRFLEVFGPPVTLISASEKIIFRGARIKTTPENEVSDMYFESLKVWSRSDNSSLSKNQH